MRPTREQIIAAEWEQWKREQGLYDDWTMADEEHAAIYEAGPREWLRRTELIDRVFARLNQPPTADARAIEEEVVKVVGDVAALTEELQRVRTESDAAIRNAEEGYTEEAAKLDRSMVLHAQAIDRAEEAEHELAALRARLDAQAGEIAGLKSERDAAMTARADFSRGYDAAVHRIATLEATVARLRGALEKLAAEVGALRAFEGSVRWAIGNTNWNVLALRRDEADAALTSTPQRERPANEVTCAGCKRPVVVTAINAIRCEDCGRERREAERKVIEAARQIAAECEWEFDQHGSWGAPSNGAVQDLLDALAALADPGAGEGA